MEGIDTILQHPKEIFASFTAEQVLWRGIDIDCSHRTFAAKAVCANLAARPQFERLENKHLLFTWGSIRNTKVGQFKVMRGHKNIQDVNRVIEYKGMTMQRVWPGDECNRFQGTDSLLFPPEMKKDTVPYAFVSDACRALPLQPTHAKGKYHGLKFIMHKGVLTNVSSFSFLWR